MIARMLHLAPDKNKLHNKQSAQSVKKHMAAYEIDNRSVYDICNDTDLYSCVFYAIHARWLCPNHVNTTASEA